jgi:hypothetical protein
MLFNLPYPAFLLRRYDLDNKFGREALEIFARFVLGEEYIEDQYVLSVPSYPLLHTAVL